jgi:6,7-dimethyl-8-ribityllumazine synthase
MLSPQIAPARTISPPMHTLIPLGRLHQGARNAFLEAGGLDDDLILVDVPGAFELVAVAHALAARSDLDAVVCLGCVITGETTHDRYICEAVANGLADISARTGRPVAFGVLTCQNLDQALARAGEGGGNAKKGNKGEEAMHAALIAAHAVQRVQRLPLGRPA